MAAQISAPFGVCLFVYIFPPLKLLPCICGLGISQRFEPRLYTGSGGLPLCTSSFWGCPLCFPVAVVDLNLSSVSLGRRDRFSICAVLSAACSRDQSHKKWLTSSLSFPSSSVYLVLFILQYFEGVCVCVV